MFKPQPDGRELAARLHSAGIPVQKVVRKRLSGHYTAEFFVPNMDAEVAPAAQWARAIRQCFHEQVTIISTHDTTANWRPGNPVICAVVAFTLNS